MKFKRIFHPVGHGAFFSEQFDNGQHVINVVYDCGTKTSSASPFALFQKTFPQGSHIDILFISHFDADHISGIEDILNDQLKNVHQPKWIDDKTYVFIPVKCYRIIQLVAQINPVYQRIFQIIVLLLQAGAHIVGIGNEKPDSEEYVEPLDLNSVNYTSTISNGTTIRIGTYWYYVLYVSKRRRSNYLDNFLMKLKQLGYTEQQICDGTINLQNIKEFKNIRTCAKANNGMNMNSLQVLSFPANKIAKSKWKYQIFVLKHFLSQHILCTPCYKTNPFRGVRNISCLYTGDNDLSKGDAYCDEMYFMLSTLFNFSQINQIGLMQIPHHGSVHNTSRLLPYDGNVGRLFVNVESNLKGCKFDTDMLKTCLITHKQFVVVSEDPNSKLMIEATL